jgi:hypothetical protein
MGGRVLVWAAVGLAAAAAAGLAVDVAFEGLEKAAGLAGVVVGFCELGALALAVIGWAAHRRASGDQSASKVTPAQPTDGVECVPTTRAGTAESKYAVDIGEAQGVQIGDGNTQSNDFRDLPRDG